MPLTGLGSMKEIAPLYANEIVFLFIGGFVFAHAIERWNLHKRIALKILTITGSKPTGILLGVMLSSYLLSMFINNTATVAMLLPAVIGITAQVSNYGNTKTDPASVLLIGLSYAASIGGMASMIGTAPNMIFVKEYNTAFPDDMITFERWLLFGIPASLLLMATCFFILKYVHRNEMKGEWVNKTFIGEKYHGLGKMSYEEKWMLFFVVFAFFMWMFLHDVTVFGITIPGWSNLFPEPGMILESSVAIFICFILHIFPAKEKGKNLAAWEDFKRVPIGIVFLFGGGFALTEAVKTSGLKEVIAGALEVTSHWHPVVFIMILITVIVILSEFASNTATLILSLSVLFAILPALEMEPLQVLITATLASSCGFMLPVATPPNTLIYDTGMVPRHKMMRAGLLLDIASVILLTLVAFTLLAWL